MHQVMIAVCRDRFAGAQRRKAIAEDAARKGPKPKRRLMMPAALYTLQHVEKLVRRYRRNRTLGDAGEKLEKPTRLLYGGRGSPLPLHLLDIFIRDQRKGSLRCLLGLQPPLAFLFDRIDPIVQFRLGLVARSASLHQADIRKTTERKLSLDATASVSKAPEQGARGLHQQIQAITISNFIRAFCG